MQEPNEAYDPEWDLRFLPTHAAVLQDMRAAAERRRKKEEDEKAEKVRH